MNKNLLNNKLFAVVEVFLFSLFIALNCGAFADTPAEDAPAQPEAPTAVSAPIEPAAGAIGSPTTAPWPAANELLSSKQDIRLTLDLQDTSLRDTLKMLSVQSGLNFIASEAVADRKITLYLDNVKLQDAMDKIFKINNLSYELDPSSNIFTIKDWGTPSLELQTKIYFLKYVRVSNSKLNQGLSGSSGSSSSSGSSGSSSGNGLKDALSAIISEYGKIIEDPATNSLIISDMPSKFSLIDSIISQLDMPIPQVLIEVEILDVDKSDVDKIGVKFTSDDSNGWFKYAGPNMGGTYFPFVSDTFRKAAAKTAPSPASWTMSGLGFVLEFLSTRSTTKYLARPKILVLNNETANLKLSSDEAIGIETTTTDTGSNSTSTSAAERAETGVSLEVTPQISISTGEITMVLEPSIKEAVTGLTVGSQSTKDVEERSIKSIVRVKDGETVIIGGLIRKRNPVTITKVPVLGDIPGIGWFFKHKSTDGTKDREILVFITPKIIKNNPLSAQKKGSILKINIEREQEPLIEDKPNKMNVPGFPGQAKQ